MTELLDRLKAALADRYTIEREIGRGGMATVYLAEDLKHHRQVAIKVLRPDLAATLGPERFLRKIEVAAQLQHPHILPLHDSGEADGFLYYVMPYVEGRAPYISSLSVRCLKMSSAERGWNSNRWHAPLIDFAALSSQFRSGTGNRNHISGGTAMPGP